LPPDNCIYPPDDSACVADQTREEQDAAIRVRDQLALGAIVCLLLSVATGMLPDGLVPASYYRTGAWLVFALLAFFCIYLAFPHTWPYSLWLAGANGGSAFGLVLLGGMGGPLFPQYWMAAIIGLLFEGASLTLLYTVLIRIRTARMIIGSKAPLGLWFLGIVLFFFFSNISAAGWAWWARTGSNSGLAGYTGFEVLAAFTAIYICWAPEELVWGSADAGTPAEPPAESEQPALLRRLAGKKDVLPKACPACGQPLKPVQLRCPSCGEKTPVGWCAAHESYVMPCPSCGTPVLAIDGRCRKCGASIPALTCPGCKRASPLKDWMRTA
jgi:predicted RNA-binding Zn-ribbon protein involved in translation (DUF1610 family)